MRLIVTDSYEKMGMEAANIVAGQVYLKPNSVLGLATGSTPVSMYQRLVAVHQSVGLDFSEVTTQKWSALLCPTAWQRIWWQKGNATSS